MLFHQIKADRTADFEWVMERLKEAMAKSENPVHKQQAAGFKVYKNPDALPQTGNIMYVVVVNPTVPDADYSMTALLNLVYKAFPEQQQDIFKRVSGAFGGGDQPREPPAGRRLREVSRGWPRRGPARPCEPSAGRTARARTAGRRDRAVAPSGVCAALAAQAPSRPSRLPGAGLPSAPPAPSRDAPHRRQLTARTSRHLLRGQAAAATPPAAAPTIATASSSRRPPAMLLAAIKPDKAADYECAAGRRSSRR